MNIVCVDLILAIKQDALSFVLGSLFSAHAQ